MQIICANGSKDLLGTLAKEFPNLNVTSPQPGVIQIEADASVRPKT